MSPTGTRGGLAAAAGFVRIHPHLTPWASARRRITWMRRIVPGLSGWPLLLLPSRSDR